jgi:type IV pilus assembly protein PilO
VPIGTTVSNIPTYQRVLVLSLLVVVIAGGFFWFIWIPKQQELKDLKKAIDELTVDIQTNQEKANKLEALKQDRANAEQQLATLQQELPLEADVDLLLKQIAELGIKSGLDIKLWRPTSSRQGTSGLYTEHPVDVEVGGGYHAVAGFFDQVGRLQRIVNVTNLKMGQAKTNVKTSQNEVVIQTSFVATAFAAAAGAPAAPAAAPPAKGRGG